MIMAFEFDEKSPVGSGARQACAVRLFQAQKSSKLPFAWRAPLPTGRFSSNSKAIIMVGSIMCTGALVPTPRRVRPSRAPQPKCRYALDKTSFAGQHLDVLGWNDLKAVEERLAKGDVAAVIWSLRCATPAAIAPRPGYLEGVRAACSKTGTILIFDEVITGFRFVGRWRSKALRSDPRPSHLRQSDCEWLPGRRTRGASGPHGTVWLRPGHARRHI